MRHRGLEGRKILVTGASGAIAGRLLHRMSSVRCELVRASRQRDLAPLGGVARTRDIVGEPADPAFWRSALDGVDTVFHLAAQTSAYFADSHPLDDLGANVLPVIHLARAAGELGTLPVVLFAGTVTQAGLPTSLPVNELAIDRPVTVYDIHKLASEHHLLHAHAQGVLRGASLRLANVYGPGPASSSADRGVLNLMVRRALAGEPLTVYGTGERLRDYIFIDDVVNAFLAAACSQQAMGGRFVVGTGTGYTIAQAIHLIAERAGRRTGSTAEVRYVSAPEGMSPIEDRDFVADAGALCLATGWTAAVGLAEGIDRTLEDYLGRPRG